MTITWWYVRPDIGKAIAAALQWRGLTVRRLHSITVAAPTCRNRHDSLPISRGFARAPEQLEQVRAAVKGGEAFHRMKYQCSECGAVEWIWNSRDGVTPFGIGMKCAHDGHHVDWQRDQYMPGYIPDVGERVFVTLTLDKAREYRRADVEAHWDTGDYPMREVFESKEAAVEKLAQGDVASFAPDTPDLVIVTAEMRETFRTREVPR